MLEVKDGNAGLGSHVNSRNIFAIKQVGMAKPTILPIGICRMRGLRAVSLCGLPWVSM